MKIYYDGQERQKKELVDTLSMLGNKNVIIVDTQEEADFILKEKLTLTSPNFNKYYCEEIKDDEIETQIKDVLLFFTHAEGPTSRTVELNCTLSLYNVNSELVKEFSGMTQFFLFSDVWCKKYDGYDLDSILYRPDRNKMYCQFTEAERLSGSPRTRAFKGLLEAL